jgi:hypothetical protein
MVRAAAAPRAQQRGPARMLLLSVGVILQQLGEVSSICSTSKDCGLLGTCLGGECKCFAGFTGSTCAVLDLVPAPPNAGLRQQVNTSYDPVVQRTGRGWDCWDRSPIDTYAYPRYLCHGRHALRCHRAGKSLELVRDYTPG